MIDSAPRPQLSVVVLCYRAGETIVSYINKMEEELREEGVADYELVLVANFHPGSGDATPDVVRGLAAVNPRIIVVAKPKQGMMGWDLRQGLAAATGEAIAIIDGDGQMPSADIVRLYRMFRGGGFDLAKTVRVAREDGAYRRLISKIYNLLFRLLFPGMVVRDINSKPKIISRRAYERMRLTADDWFADAELMLEARRLKLRVGELPTVFRRNEWRASFVKPWTIIEFLKNLVTYRLRYWRQR